MPEAYVNIYSVGRAYGGPEEGDWWFDTGTPIGSIPVELSEKDFDQLRLDAIDAKVLAYDASDDMFHAVLNRKAHVHDDWCEPRENDTYAGQPLPEFSTRCYEKDWRQFRKNWVRNFAQPVADKWREVYAPTGKRSSVLGGDDYEVYIEDHFARPFPEKMPRYE